MIDRTTPYHQFVFACYTVFAVSMVWLDEPVLAAALALLIPARLFFLKEGM